MLSCGLYIILSLSLHPPFIISHSCSNLTFNKFLVINKSISYVAVIVTQLVGASSLNCILLKCNYCCYF